MIVKSHTVPVMAHNHWQNYVILPYPVFSLIGAKTVILFEILDKFTK
jgi:hypothetical protein